MLSGAPTSVQYITRSHLCTTHCMSQKNQKKVSTDNEGVNRVLGYSHTTYAPPLLKLIPEFKVYSNQGGFYLAEKYGKMMLDGGFADSTT